jgi:hypothetical protein
MTNLRPTRPRPVTAFFVSCMLLQALLYTRHSGIGGAVHVAAIRSSSTSFTFSKSRLAVCNRYRGGATYTTGTGTTALPLKAFGRTNGEQREEGEGEAKTGWTRKLPNKEQTSSTSSSSAAGKPRTGWLHYDSAGQRAKEANQQQQQQKQQPMSEARRRLEQAMKEEQPQGLNHRILTPPTFHACGENRCLVVTEHEISVPLFRPGTNKSARRINLFFSVVGKVTKENSLWLEALQSLSLSPTQRAKDYVTNSNLQNADTMALYLQGGPGFGSPTPMVSLALTKESSWAAAAIDNGYQQIILMDQRGTGRSTPITKQTLEQLFPDLFLLDNPTDNDEAALKALVEQAAEETTEYLAQFRADNIVLDAEAIKEALLMPTEEPVKVSSNYFGVHCIQYNNNVSS